VGAFNENHFGVRRHQRSGRCRDFLTTIGRYAHQQENGSHSLFQGVALGTLHTRICRTYRYTYIPTEFGSFRKRLPSRPTTKTQNAVSVAKAIFATFVGFQSITSYSLILCEKFTRNRGRVACKKGTIKIQLVLFCLNLGGW